MNLNRREFIILSAAMAAGCKSQGGENPTAALGAIDAGPVANYSADGVYDSFIAQGFFIVRSADKLFAVSSQCTHQACTLVAATDRTFHCNCHGSSFDANGKVVNGPAMRDLPVLVSETNGKGHLIVKI